jgi:pimeloyl-ACP methyl ester carboxylesterase
VSSTVAFIHSTGLGPFMWEPYLACVEHSAVVTPYNLGYHPDQPLERPGVAGLADDAEHLRRSLLARGPVHLVAHSWGATVALELARTRAIDVRSLWLFEPVLFGALASEVDRLDTQTATELRATLANFRSLGADQAGSDDWLRAFIDYWNGDGAWGRMSERARQATRRVGWKMYQEVRSTIEETHSFDAYRFDIPVTLVTGGRSQRAARAMVLALAQRMPRAHVHDVAALGHMGVVDDPSTVVRLLQDHLKGLAMD